RAALRGARRASLSAADAAEAVALRGDRRRVQWPRDRAPVVLGSALPAPGRGAAAGLPDDQSVPGAAPRGLRGAAGGDGAHRAGLWSGEARAPRDRRHEGPGEHVAVEGDEPPADAGGRGPVEGRDRADPGADGRAERRGGRRARGRRRERRAAGGAPAARGTTGEDPRCTPAARGGEGGAARGPAPEELRGP